MNASAVFHLASTRATSTLFVFGLCTALLGCEKKPSDLAPITASSAVPMAAFNEAEAAKPNVATGMTADAKVQDYVACYNSLSNNVQESMSSYTLWVGNMQTGPSGKEKNIQGITALDTERIEQCKKALAFVASQAPAMPQLDTAGAKYMSALEKLAPIVEEAHQYYATQAYKTDNFAQGRSLHAPLAQHLMEVQSAANTLSLALDTQNDALLSTQLNEVEQTQGRNMTYWQLALMHKAKPLARTLSKPAFDVTDAATLLVAYEAVADDTLAYTKTHPQPEASSWQALTTAGTNLRIAAQQRVNRVREKAAYTAAEKRTLKTQQAHTVNGSAESLIKAYNDLVEANNNL